MWILWGSILLLSIAWIAEVYYRNGNMLGLIPKKRSSLFWWIPLIGSIISLFGWFFYLRITQDFQGPLDMIISWNYYPAKFIIWMSFFLLVFSILLEEVPSQINIRRRLDPKICKACFYCGLVTAIFGLFGLLYLFLPLTY
jgi:hypothetical protein